MALSASRQRETVAQYLDAGEWAKAGELCHDLLVTSPDDAETLYWMIRVFVDTDKPAIGRILANQLTQAAPDKWQSWMILGACEAYLQRFPESYQALKKANKMQPNNAEILRLLGNSLVMQYNWDGVKYARQSLDLEDNHQAHTVIAFAHLHKREWTEGWKHYRKQLGHVPGREQQNFGLPEWRGDGEPLVYAEQGLGDQIAYMSAVTPYQLTCHPKLKNLFARTFRDVHGDQFNTVIDWPVTAQYQTSMASAMQYVGMQPRGRYLNVCPDKKRQWQALLDKPGKKIGIAWTGGTVGSYGWQGRNLTLEQLLPILQMDATFVSLEYKDRSDEIRAFKEKHGITIHDWHWGTRTNDYDDTAALVDCLDAVVCVPTTIYHLAGALGIDAHVLVHDKPHFHEGISGPSPWWQSVALYRRKHMGTRNAIEAIKCVL